MSKTDAGRRGSASINRVNTGKGITRIMAEITIVYWRDIPAQVIVGKGRSGSKAKLTERFEQAIDRCAMKIGAAGTDAYLAEWRKVPTGEVAGSDEEAAEAELARILSEYGPERLRALIETDGWEQSPPA